MITLSDIRWALLGIATSLLFMYGLGLFDTLPA